MTDDEYNFEVYQRQHGRSLGRGLLISLAPNGIIRFSESALAALGNPQYVALMFDRSRLVIGIRNLERGENDGFQVNRAILGRTCYISAKAFVTYYSLDYGRTRRLPAFMQGRVLCAPLRPAS